MTLLSLQLASRNGQKGLGLGGSHRDLALDWPVPPWQKRAAPGLPEELDRQDTCLPSQAAA